MAILSLTRLVRYGMFTFTFVERYRADYKRRIGGMMARAGTMLGQKPHKH